MSARTDLAAQLKAALPRFTITGYPRDQVNKPTVCLWQTAITKATQFGLDVVMVNLDLWVLTGITDPGKADDALDDSLEQVMAALQPLDWVEWSTAERLVLEEVQAHGYKLTLTAIARITPSGD